MTNKTIKEITINKAWYDGLVKIIEDLNKQIEIDDKSVEIHGCLSYLNGYVHSFDEQLNNKHGGRDGERRR